MSLDLSSLPDEAEAYIAGVGVVSVGELRAARAEPVSVGGWTPAEIRFWTEKVTRNLRPLPCGDTRQARKASTE